VDLHCHTSWSPDSLSRPDAVARVAAERGLTHLAITDHGRLEGALEAREAAPTGLSVIVGEEIRTTGGDLIGLFLERPVPNGLSAAEAAAAIHEQGGIVGLPHPFDRFRGSLLRGRRDGVDGADGQARGSGTDALDPLAGLVDYVETFNARVVVPGSNERAAAWAAAHDLPGAAVSDAHTLLEVGVAYLVVDGPIGDAEALRAALPAGTMVASRASFVVRAVTPVARVIQRLRHPERFGSERATTEAPR